MGASKRPNKLKWALGLWRLLLQNAQKKKKKKESGAFESADRHEALCLHSSFWSSSAGHTDTSEQRHTKLCIYPTFTC